MRTVFYSFLVIVTVTACSPRLSPDSSWRDRKWVVSEVNGTPVQLSGTNRDAHLYFSPSDKRFTGSGGCNRISGSYTINNNGRLSFSEPNRTKMACDDIAFEDNFLNLLERVDRYTVENDMMLLKDGNRVVLLLK
jgi:heat shock protein HslJ